MAAKGKTVFSSLEQYAQALSNGAVPVGKDMVFTACRDHSATRSDSATGISADSSYSVRVHHDRIAQLLRSQYTRQELQTLRSQTSDIRRIAVVKKPWGTFINAASFSSEEEAAATNYDAIWVRDSIWGYYALAAQSDRSEDAKAVLLTQLDYMSSQSAHIDRVIASPELLDMPEPAASMNAVHIRFNAQSPDYDDVMEDGEPQLWTHKQNDALALLISAAVSAFLDGTITLGELTQPVSRVSASTPPDTHRSSVQRQAGDPADQCAGDCRLAAIARLVAYLNAAKFYQMEDSGAWEEELRRNTSSIGIAVSALEDLKDLLSLEATHDGLCTQETRTGEACEDFSKEEDFSKAYGQLITELGLEKLAGIDAISELIAQGNAVIHRQIRLGGESPDYAADDPRYRQADAALLSLIYPAHPRELSIAERLRILDIVASLVGDVGIRRYRHDTYQSGNFWWNDIKTDADPESHAKRESGFIEGTEAEWFFDSWYAKCALIVAKEIEDAAPRTPVGQEKSRIVVSDDTPKILRQTALRHMNRALGQITGEGMLSADGKEVAANLLPESYNHIVDTRPGSQQSWPVPSPIAPLNWAKASLTLCLEEFLQTTKER
jgi:hypothetical protein